MGLQTLIDNDRGKSATFPTIGTSYAGRVTASTPVQARNYTTNEPEVWDDGSPKMQAAISIQTDLRDPAVEKDDGIRTVYVKWWGPWRTALQEAMRQAGDTDIRVGGWFSATYSANGEATKGNAPKLFVYQYQQPPAQGTGLPGTGAPAGTAPPAPAAPPAPPAVPAAFTPPAAPTPPPPAPPAPPAAPIAPPPPAPAPVGLSPEEGAALLATVKAWQAAGWTDVALAEHPEFKGKVSLTTLTAIRNS